MEELTETLKLRLLTDNIAKQLLKICKKVPEIAIILGSGLADFANSLKESQIINYDELNGMPKSHIEGHKNQFIVGDLNGKTVIAMLGRFHMYDGFTAKESALPIYIFKKMGIDKVIITNASGGVNASYNAGDIMVITDHINFTGRNPLINGAVVESPEKFVDLSNCYTKEWIEIIKKIAQKHQIDLRYGTYIQFLGPSYETPAEVKMARTMGADAVGMSTVMEAIASAQCNMKVLGLSSISNKAVGLTNEKITHEEVLRVSELAKDKLIVLISEFVNMI